MKQRRLYKAVKSLVFRRRMAETMESLEDKIRVCLLNEGKEEMVSGSFKISVKGDGEVEIRELPGLNVEQLELTLVTEPKIKERRDGKE